MIGKAVAIVSGGLDSITMLHSLVADKMDVYPLTFEYGQKHSREISSAKYFCKKLGLESKHKVINLSPMAELFGSSALVNSEIQIPQIHDKRQRTKEVLSQTVVPFRNGIFLSMAGAYAYSIHATEIYYAAHASDSAIYPDCRPEFVASMNKSIRFGLDDNHIKLIAPFIGNIKSEIVMMAKVLDVEFSKTWSCYSGGAEPCDVCPSCIERKTAFEKAGITDQ